MLPGLDEDDLCGTGSGSGHCALSMLQRRAPRSCQEYGCGVGYKPSRSCQCDPRCAQHRNCCADYASLCAIGNSSKTEGRDDDSGAQVPVSVQKVFGHPSPLKEYPEYDGFDLVLVEEFDEPIDVNSDPIWTWSDGALSESQVRYIKEAIKFENGVMKLEMGPLSGTPNMQPCSNAESRLVVDRSMTSGEMRTKYNMFRYGRYEWSMKAPSVQLGDTTAVGSFVSTMFLFRDAKYHHWRELQFEILGGDVDDLHTNVMSAENQTEFSTSMQDPTETFVGTNLREGFHTYVMEWLPDRITWYFDDLVVREKLADDGSPISIPEFSAKIMMSLWVAYADSGFGGLELQTNRYPMHSEYDWFRFYRWIGDEKYPCAGLSTDCLTEEDRYLSSNNPCDGIAQVGTLLGEPPCVATCPY